jgi:hypothetical protein
MTTYGENLMAVVKVFVVGDSRWGVGVPLGMS